MSTRCGIALELKDKSVVAVYCHDDGYVEGVGMDLDRYWNSYKKAEELIHHWDIRSIDKKKVKVFKDANPDKIQSFHSLNDYKRNGWDVFGAEYLYVFIHKHWYVTGRERWWNNEWYEIDEALQHIEYMDTQQ